MGVLSIFTGPKKARSERGPKSGRRGEALIGGRGRSMRQIEDEAERGNPEEIRDRDVTRR